LAPWFARDAPEPDVPGGRSESSVVDDDTCIGWARMASKDKERMGAGNDDERRAHMGVS
jgi:hypothetical protein